MSDTGRKHTAGPWIVYHEGGSMGSGGHWGVETASEPKETVAVCRNNRHNARLIAAAPDMLDALHDAINDWQTNEGVLCDDTAHMIRAAIRKATGEGR